MRVFKSYNTGNKYQSFLEVLSKESFIVDDINKKAILDFLTFGSLYFEETFINKIHKNFTHQPHILDIKDGLIKTPDNPKNPLVDSIIEDSVHDFISFFEQRVKHLETKKISVDLTGGIDSRLIAVILHYFGVQFDTAFSLNSGDENELNIAKRVAELLGVKFTVLSSSNEVESESEIDHLFAFSDGLWNVLKLKAIIENQKWRTNQGYDLVITGVGGELYKDFWWQQDFPFYKSDESNLQRLINTRMYAANIPVKWFGDYLKPAASTYYDSFKRDLMQFEKATNTQTYDQIYYHVRIKEQVSFLSEVTQKYLDTYSPLLEPELLKIGYNLPRGKRFFNRFHRILISKLNPDVAKIPTTEGGMSVSNNFDSLFRDIAKYGIIKSRKAYIKFFKAESDHLKNNTSNVPKVIEHELDTSLKVLKELEILHHSVDVRKIPIALYGRFITIGRVLSLIHFK